MPRMTAEDKRWQAESDARSMAETKVIQQDKPRLNAAKKAASRMATEKQKEASAMKRVARTTSTKQSVKKRK